MRFPYTDAHFCFLLIILKISSLTIFCFKGFNPAITLLPFFNSNKSLSRDNEEMKPSINLNPEKTLIPQHNIAIPAGINFTSTLSPVVLSIVYAIAATDRATKESR